MNTSTSTHLPLFLMTYYGLHCYFTFNYHLIVCFSYDCCVVFQKFLVKTWHLCIVKLVFFVSQIPELTYKLNELMHYGVQFCCRCCQLKIGYWMATKRCCTTYVCVCVCVCACVRACLCAIVWAISQSFKFPRATLKIVSIVQT